ncbi:MAG: Hpt domain-containing protein [Nitrospinota bacterium]|nr:Hpt domain-containing protein [Nitrospinota bacterium]
MTEGDMKHGVPSPARVVNIDETKRRAIPPGNEKSNSEKPPFPDAEGTGMEEYLDDFLSEFDQALVSMSVSLDALESNPTDMVEINSLYRNAHNMKGGSNAMGLLRLGAFFLSVESVIEPFRSSGLPFSGKVAGAIRVAFASLEKAPLSMRRMKSDNELGLAAASAALYNAVDGNSPMAG